MTGLDYLALALALLAANIGLWAIYKWLTEPPKD